MERLRVQAAGGQRRAVRVQAAMIGGTAGVLRRPKPASTIAAMALTPRAAPPSFSADDFRAALAMFATGVTIVTARTAGGEPIGLTANSFNSVSIDPPLVLWSLSRQAGSMPAFARGSHYAINILAADQRALAERFASKDVQRFEGVSFRTGASGVPLLDGAAAVFECFNRSRYEEGDHVIFVGEVEACVRGAVAQPLIFHGGRYFTELPL
jgi:flavin reductase (DIM6/NTAB) family NADH-FMN oxidoreductase RutF